MSAPKNSAQNRRFLWLLLTFVLSVWLTGACPECSEGLDASARVATDNEPQNAPHRIRAIPIGPLLVHEIGHDTSPPLRSLHPHAENGHTDSRFRLGTNQSRLQIPTPIITFEGLSNIANVIPPNPSADVSLNHYFQSAGGYFQIWDKNGTSIYGPVRNNTIWKGFSGPCWTTNGSGSLAVLYDPMARRWFVSTNTFPNFPNGPFIQCIAVSQTPDPTGQWHRYAFTTSQTKFLDYPQFGVWPDGYYMTANLFEGSQLDWAGTGQYVFDRARMLAGQSATMQYFEQPPTDWGWMLPTDFAGSIQPPAGSPNYFVEVNDDAWNPPNMQDELLFWRFHVDWSNPTNTTFTGPAHLPVAPFDGIPCPGIPRDSCIPQPDTSTTLDARSKMLMPRLAYRNLGDHESLVLNHTVKPAASPNGHTGMRWYELRNPQTAVTIFQQGTYAPDLTSRWLGSIGMDREGNIAAGFSASSSSVYPSIRYAGRLASDPPGTFAQGEATLQAGTGSVTGSGRWSSASALSVDPADDCTFWYTNQYYPVTGSTAWHTRIGAFKFPSCGAGTPTVTPIGTTTPTLTATHTPALTFTHTSTLTPTTTPTPCIVTPTWHVGPPMATARYGAHGALASDGNPRPTPVTRFYVVGGVTSGNTPISEVSGYNPLTNAWEQFASLPSATGKMAVGGTSHYVFAAGGYVGGSGPDSVTNTLRIYDAAANTWSTGQPMPARIEAAAGVVMNGRFYVIGGDDSTNTLGTNYVYDMGANVWSIAAPIPGLRKNAYATAFGGRIYLFGGLDESGQAVDTVHLYDPGNPGAGWVSLGSLQTGGYGNYGGILLYGAGMIVLDGGNSSFVPTSTTHLGVGRTGPPLNTARMGMAQGTLPDGRVIVAGGLINDQGAVTNSVEILQPPQPCVNTPTPTSTSAASATATTTVAPPTLTTVSTVTPSRTRTPLPTCSPIPTFTDVSSDDWYYQYVLCLACRGVVSGYADGTFRPYANTTRGQMSKIAVLAVEWPVNCPPTPHFTDVPPDSPFYCFIETAYEHEIIAGYEDGEFRPGNLVTRGQICKMMVSAMGWTRINPPDPTFRDVPPGGTFYEYIETAVCHRIISGYADGTFQPGNNATRAQIAKIVCLAMRNEHDCTRTPTLTP